MRKRTGFWAGLAAIVLSLGITSGSAQQPSTISAMPYASTPLNGAELVNIVQQGQSRKTTSYQLAQLGPGSIVAGSTSILGTCTNGYNLYNNAGVVGCQANGGGSGPVVNPAANCNGIFDNQPVVQAAITSIASTGGTIQLPAGTCYFGSAVQLSSGIHIKGVGAGATILTATGPILKNPAAGSETGTTYAINTPTLGVNSFTTTTAGNAANFAAGNYVLISGTKNGTNFWYPSWWGQVQSSNSSTGVVTLTEPLPIGGVNYSLAQVVNSIDNDIGISDLTVESTSSSGILLQFVQNCYISNVSEGLTQIVGDFVEVTLSRNVIADNIFQEVGAAYAEVDFYAAYQSQINDSVLYNGQFIFDGGSLDSIMSNDIIVNPSTWAVSSGTYNSTTGLVTLTLQSPAIINPGNTVLVSGAAGTGSFASINGSFTAGSGTTSTAVTYTIATGLTMTIAGGTAVLPTVAFSAGSGSRRNKFLGVSVINLPPGSTGIQIGALNGEGSNLIDGCTILGTGNTGGAAISISASNFNTVSNCVFSNVYDGVSMSSGSLGTSLGNSSGQSIGHLLYDITGASTVSFPNVAGAGSGLQIGLLCPAAQGNSICLGDGVTATISSGTYNSGTGLVTLTLSSTPNLAQGNSVTVSGATGTGSFASINGTFTAGAGTGANIVTYTVATSLTMTITGGNFSAGGLFYNPIGSLDLGIGAPPAAGARLDIQGGALRVGTGAVGTTGDIGLGRNGGSSGFIQFGSSGTVNLGFSGSTFTFTGGGVAVASGNLVTNSGGILASGRVSGTNHVTTGSVPVGTTGSCTASSLAGGTTAGTFSAALCAGGTFILSNFPATTNGYVCDAQDQTTPADTLKQTANTTSSVTFTGTTVASDVVAYKCMGF